MWAGVSGETEKWGCPGLTLSSPSRSPLSAPPSARGFLPSLSTSSLDLLVPFHLFLRQTGSSPTPPTSGSPSRDLEQKQEFPP